MSRVLLVCPEPLGHGQPAGIGIRFVEIARVLIADGHAVTVLSPDGGRIHDAEGAGTLTPESIHSHSAAADVAVVQGHVANDFIAHAHRIPTVIDLYDPFIIENLHYHSTRGTEVYAHDHATLMRSLEYGDFFLCASEAQRMFYLGALLAAGRLNPVAFESDATLRRLVAIAPFGVQPPRTAVRTGGHHVLFGGIYDWYDPILAIDAIARARNRVQDVTLTFTTHPNAAITPQGVAAEAMEYVRRQGYGDFIRFEPWVAYDRRAEFFDRFAISLLTFRGSIETDLAMRTRIYDFLWGNLPVISSPAPGTDEILERYGAGAVIQSNAADAFADEIVAILSDDATSAAMRRGAGRFVDENQWARVLDPLRAFCKAPQVDATRATFTTSHALPPQPRPSILQRVRRRIGAPR
jgi:glycosyltransferase involved in cell wall biosynthesis